MINTIRPYLKIFISFINKYYLWKFKFSKSTSTSLPEMFEYNFLYLCVVEDNLQITVVCKLLNIKNALLYNLPFLI